MLKIAIVDDMARDIHSLVAITNKIADEWNDEFHIKTFESGEAICADLERNTYDVILLDIQMDGMDGGETAKKIDALAPTSYVIFITSYSDMAGCMYDFNVIGFLHKPATKESIEELLKKVVSRIKVSVKHFTYTYNGVSHCIKIDEILYVSVYDHKLYINAENKENVKENGNIKVIEMSGSLKNAWERLKKFDEFAVAHRSMIVNLNYVNFVKLPDIEIKKDGVVFDKIRVSKNAKSEFIARHMDYMEKLTTEGR